MTGGSGTNGRARTTSEHRVFADRELSDRHREWGHDCPAVDLDFLLCEYNHGAPVAIVDYKHSAADLSRTNQRTYETLGRLYDEHGQQIPFFIARYWPDTWAFKVHPENDAAHAWMQRVLSEAATTTWVDMTEQEYVSALYWLRKDALTAGDRKYIERLNTAGPPAEGACV
jgi:hypothetical protein